MRAVSLRMVGFAVFAVGCSSSPGGGPGGGVPDAGGSPPATRVLLSSAPEPGLRRELVQIEAPAPAPNPTTGESTPAELNHTLVVRYRQDVAPAVPVRSVVVAVPGFLAGAGAFDRLARTLVQRSIRAGAPIEFWAVDRRSNQLEDLRGMAVARDAGDPEVATGYYFGAAPVQGQSFAGLRTQGSLGYISEWGLATHVGDLVRVLDVVSGEGKGHVFLLGHSLGAFFVEAFAGWRFGDGSRGADRAAGLILMDGALAAAPLDETSYRTNGSGSGIGAIPGLSGIRSTTRYVELPFLGISSEVVSEILALRALATPGAVIGDNRRNFAFQLLLGLPAGSVPNMTNRAALGFAFDVRFNPLPFVTASLGQPDGGAVDSYQSLLGGTFLHPTDPAATYDWVDAPLATPPGFTSLADFAAAYSFDGTNFVEWYFPARLSLDLAAVGGGAVPEAGYQATVGLRVFDGPRNDAPVLAISGALVPPSALQAVAARIGPTVGPQRVAAGASRSSPAGFRVVDGTGLSHVDLLTAADRAANPVPAAIEQFLSANAASGTVTVGITSP